MEAIEVINVTKTFKNFDAVKEASFCVRQGEIFGFLGENGAGKSTTIRMLLGLIWPTEGEVRLNGITVVPGTGEALRGVGAIVEQPCFYGNMTVEQNLRLTAQLSGGCSQPQIEELLVLLGLDSMRNKRAGIMSHGQKQRLGIAQALLPDNSLLILDEPQDGLDPHWIRETRRLLSLLKQRGVTVLISSHRLNEIEQVCDRVGIIHRGRMLYEGRVEPLLNATEYISISCEPMDKACTLLREHGKNVSPNGNGTLQVHAPTNEQAAQINEMLVSKAIAVSEMSRIRLSLEDVFLNLTGKDAETRQ
ncbi:MAG TPA: ABC transporter ATP-binding protein [bacterium]|nr:ABC transporter ATP-binding protein [bacterium]